MDVLFEPPILYLVIIMLWWGVEFVPFILKDDDHFMVCVGAVVHTIMYSWLVHLSVPLESWLLIVGISSMLVISLTIGGYVLHYLQTKQRQANVEPHHQEKALNGSIG